LIRFEMLDEIRPRISATIHRLLVHDELTGLLTGNHFSPSCVARRPAPRRIDAFLCLMMDTVLKSDDTSAIWSGSENWKQLAQSSNNPARRRRRCAFA